MAGTMASVGESTQATAETKVSKEKILGSILRLSEWLERNNYQGYDTFDGLNAKIRPLTFNNPLLLTILQQGVRRFPLNPRPLFGLSARSTQQGYGLYGAWFYENAGGDWRRRLE